MRRFSSDLAARRARYPVISDHLLAGRTEISGRLRP
jgi:hypothetical protein